MTINITDSIYFNNLTVSSGGWIYFNNLRSSDLATETLTFNITNEKNITIYGPPIWFSSSTSTSKHIASNLSQAITATIILDSSTDCGSTLNKLTYTPKDGTTSTYYGSQARNICNQLKSTGYALTINPSAESNVLEFSYDCTEYEGTTYPIINIAMALIILMSVVGYVYVRGGITSLNVADLFVLVVLIFLGMAFMQSVGDTTALRCAP